MDLLPSAAASAGPLHLATSILLGAALVLAPGGCLLDATDDRPTGAVELTLYDRPVRCETGAACQDEAGQLARGEYHRVRAAAQVGRSGARAALRLRLSIARPGGEQGVLSLVLPFGAPVAGSAAPAPVVSYVETYAGQKVFRGEQVSGRFELAVDPSCACQIGRFELLLLDPGLDGALGTADDRVRRLSAGRLRLDERPFCHGRQVLPLREGVLVVGTRACPANARGRPGAGVAAGSCAWGVDGWLADDWNADGWYDDDWQGDWERGTPNYDDGGGWDEDRGWDDGVDGWSSYEEQTPTGYDESGAGCSDCTTGGDGWDGWDDWGGGWDDGSSDSTGDSGWSSDGSGDDGWSSDGSGSDSSGSDSSGSDSSGSSDWGSDAGADDSWGDDGWDDDG